MIELARYRSFEDVAGLLWDGDPMAPWELDADSRRLIRAVRAALPRGGRRVSMRSRSWWRRSAPPTGAAPTGVRRQSGELGRGSSPACLRSSTESGCRRPAQRAAAPRLWRALRDDGARARSAQVAALNAALVLLADHELAASTLAARVAAIGMGRPLPRRPGGSWSARRSAPRRRIARGRGPAGGDRFTRGRVRGARTPAAGRRRSRLRSSRLPGS